jgi:glycosyltransferase involved in cell wall biosynthesis
MRICLFTATFLPKIGGHETVVDELARHLNQSGHEAIVLAQHTSVKGTRGVVDVPYEVIRFRKPCSQIHDLGTLRRALIRLHEKWPFEILHSHSSYPTGFVAVEIGKKLNVPVIITPHGSDIAETSRFRDRPVIQKRIAHALEKADAVTILSAYMKGRATLISPESASHFFAIPNGIHFDWFSKSAEEPVDLDAEIVTARENYFLFMGRLHPRKGVDVLIKSFQTVAAEIPNSRLVIAGQGTEEAALLEQAKQSGFANRIHFVGSVQGQKKLWLLQNACALVVPTKSWEAFCVVVMEGMASGVPVIGTRVGGIVDLIEPGRDGMLVSPNDTGDLAKALREMFANGSRIEMGERGREKSRRYDWPLVTRQYVELFEKLLAAKKKQTL